jgi:hypothetical protein
MVSDITNSAAPMAADHAPGMGSIKARLAAWPAIARINIV